MFHIRLSEKKRLFTYCHNLSHLLVIRIFHVLDQMLNLIYCLHQIIVTVIGSLLNLKDLSNWLFSLKGRPHLSHFFF